MAKLFARIIRTRSGYPQWHNIKREVERTIDRKVKPEVLSYFTRITDLWKHDVGFQARKRVTGKFVRLYVYPTGPNKEIWGYVTGGTKPHAIVPKWARALRFRTDYKPRTGRGYRYRGLGKATGPIVFAQRVWHPGTEAREFEKHITRFYKPKFRRHIENAMRRGMRRL